LRLPLMIKPWRCPNLPRPLHRIAPESPMIARMARYHQRFLDALRRTALCD
jgi:hypothetical protein